MNQNKVWSYEEDSPVVENNNRVFSILPIMIFLMLAVFLLAFWGIDRRSIWLDEAYSVLVASQNFDGIIASLKNDTGPPLYYFILSVWVQIFGIGEFAVRSLSGVFYLLSLGAVYFLGNSLYKDKITGLMCSFFYMVSDLTILHAQSARMYSLLALLGILSTLFYLRIFLIKSIFKKTDFALYIFFNILGTFTHYWFPFILLSQVVAHIVLFPRSTLKKFSLAMLMSVFPFFVLWSPTLLIQMKSGGAWWMPKPGYNELLNTILGFYGGGGQALLLYGLISILILLKLDSSEIRLQKVSELKHFTLQKQNLVFLVFISVSLFVPLIFSQVKPIYAPARGPIIGLLPFVMVVASFLTKFANKLLLLVCCYILLSGAVSTKKDLYDPDKYSDRSTAQYLVTYANDNDILIFTSLSRTAIDYYFRLMKPDKTFIEISFPKEIDSHPGWINVDEMLRRKPILDDEVDQIITSMHNLTQNNKKQIWLFYGSDIKIGRILKQRLDANFLLKETKDLQGSFYNMLLVYQNR